MTISTTNYKRVIDNLDVVHTSKYQPVNDKTYCNFFAQDVARDCGTPLPSGRCQDMLDALKGNNVPHWYSVNYSDAQRRANQGYPTIGITSSHVVVIYPHGNTPSSIYDLYMSMAGYKCFNDALITEAWLRKDFPSVRFYSWYEKE